LPIGYRLRRNNVRLGDLVPLNERSAFFTITNAQPPFTNYAIIVTNAARTGGLLSASAFLTFVLDTDGDGLPDSWESAYGLGTNNMADATLDADGDGMSNWQEFIAGTDPTNALSFLKIDLLSSGSNSTTLQLQAISNKTYPVQYRDALTRAQWA